MKANLYSVACAGRTRVLKAGGRAARRVAGSVSFCGGREGTGFGRAPKGDGHPEMGSWVLGLGGHPRVMGTPCWAPWCWLEG